MKKAIVFLIKVVTLPLFTALYLFLILSCATPVMWAWLREDKDQMTLSKDTLGSVLIEAKRWFTTI
jgi:hypothetical protein